VRIHSPLYPLSRGKRGKEIDATRLKRGVRKKRGRRKKRASLVRYLLHREKKKKKKALPLPHLGTPQQKKEEKERGKKVRLSPSSLIITHFTPRGRGGKEKRGEVGTTSKGGGPVKERREREKSRTDSNVRSRRKKN